MITAADVKVPLDVAPENRNTYIENYLKITHHSGRLMLFAGDQKFEHLNDDFYGEGISEEDADPVHMFNIASKAKIGVFVSQLGLIARYGMDFPKIPYIVKLNAKTNLVKPDQSDPYSKNWQDIHQVIEFKKNSGLDIVGIGYTIYFGSEFEAKMIHEACTAIYEAHKNGMLAVIWAYPRGKAVGNEYDSHLIAGAAGAVACIGGDFAKIFPPKVDGKSAPEKLQEAVKAAGRTKVICMGGSSTSADKFFQTLYDQIHLGGASGNATGRNIHQRPLDEAVRFCNAIYAITVEDKTVEEAMKIYQG